MQGVWTDAGEFERVGGHLALYHVLRRRGNGQREAKTLKTLNAVIAQEHQWPISLDNPYWFHLGSWWVWDENWRKFFGEMSDVETCLQATQFMQAIGVQYAIESNRRRAWRNSGSIPWQFNEPYPNAACTSAVDYFANPKPLYHAVARAFEPLHLSAKFPTFAWGGREQFEAELWVSNAYERAWRDVMLASRIVDANGKVYINQDKRVAFAANHATHIGSLQWPLVELTQDVFFLDLQLTAEDGALLSRNRYVFSRSENFAPLFAIPPTTLDTSRQIEGDQWRVSVKNTGDTVALFVWLEDAREAGAHGYVYFNDNHFCLFPGEAVTIGAQWSAVRPDARRISVQAWNIVSDA